MATVYPTNYKEWLEKLVGFNTISANSNLPLVHYVRDYLASVGIAAVLVPGEGAERDTHANLWATLPPTAQLQQAKAGSAPAPVWCSGGLILSGHTDVVPVEGQVWATDPFTLTYKEADQCYYGRGTADMKGFLAVVLALTPTFLAMERSKPIHFSFSYSEEIGCVGAGFLVRYLQQKEVRGKPFSADGCLIGEPTGMDVYVGNKGTYRWVVKVHGKPIHSSRAMLGMSCNAIDYAAQIVMKIKELANKIRDNGFRDERYECPFACVTTALIEGGNAVNTVPEHCKFTFSIRILKNDEGIQLEKDVQAYIDSVVLPEMRKEFAEASVTLTRGVHFPAFVGDEKAPFTRQVMHVCKVDKTSTTSGGTEGGFFQDHLNIPSVIAGPGDVQHIHVADERVSAEHLERCTKMVTDLATLITGAHKRGNL